ncbi:MAG: type II secretion system F family protein [Nitrospiraceae bacterium]|nr:MAG: type II secretion system F family protein [Nitrospiraceae bacterium]
MPVYVYEAIDSSGKKIKETVSDSDEASLKSSLREKGLVPISIAVSKSKKTTLFKRITQKDLLTFTQELGNLLDSGLPIDRALYVLSEYADKKAFRSIIREVYVDIQKGSSLSAAMAKHKTFPRVYINMVKAGEAGGILDAVIRRLTSFLETSISFTEEIISALIYPVLLTLVGGLAITVLMVYVVPEFAQIFADMGQTLPLPTLMLIAISTFFASYWWAFAALVVLGFFLIRYYAKTAEGKRFFDTLKLKIPVLNKLTMKLVISRFARTFGTLLHGGVPILQAIRISRDVVDNEIISQQLAVLEDGVNKGRGLSLPLRESGVFPGIVTQMVTVGEEAGRLEETFLLIAERFESDTKSLIKRFVSLFEPFLILIMGLIVGLIVISMLYGIFSINEIPL